MISTISDHFLTHRENLGCQGNSASDVDITLSIVLTLSAAGLALVTGSGILSEGFNH